MALDRLEAFSDKTGHRHSEVITMKREREPRIVPRLGTVHLPTEQAGAEESIPKQKALGTAETQNQRTEPKGIVGQVLSLSRYGVGQHRVEDKSS
jgi:hypothetical protein